MEASFRRSTSMLLIPVLSELSDNGEDSDEIKCRENYHRGLT